MTFNNNLVPSTGHRPAAPRAIKHRSSHQLHRVPSALLVRPIPSTTQARDLSRAAIPSQGQLERRIAAARCPNAALQTRARSPSLPPRHRPLCPQYVRRASLIIPVWPAPAGRQKPSKVGGVHPPRPQPAPPLRPSAVRLLLSRHVCSSAPLEAGNVLGAVALGDGDRDAGELVVEEDLLALDEGVGCDVARLLGRVRAGVRVRVGVRVGGRGSSRACSDGMASSTSWNAGVTSPWHSAVVASGRLMANIETSVSTPTESSLAWSARPTPATLRSSRSRKVRLRRVASPSPSSSIATIASGCRTE